MNKMLKKNTLITVILSGCAHFFSTFIYSFVESDSLNSYFAYANNDGFSFGTSFIQYLTWHVRENISGDSYLATLYFFSSFSFLGSILWYYLYLKVNRRSIRENEGSIVPALILMCWPSFFFFTSAIGKDSLCFFLIPCFFLSFHSFKYEKRKRVISIPILVFCLLFITIIRPYLLIIFVFSHYLSNVETFRKLKVSQALFIVCMLPVIFLVAQKIVKEQASIEQVNIESISKRASFYQVRQSKGTSFPTISNDPFINILCLPYSFVMNLVMPLFVFAGNKQGIFASFENLFLLYLIYKLYKSRKLFKKLRIESQEIRFYFCFFVVGMSFIALINTNLGLATRQKAMYLPSLLVIMMIVRDLEYKQKLLTNENSNNSKRLAVST